MGKFGHLTTEQIEFVLHSANADRDQIRYFVETGTYHGDSTRVAASMFENVHTIDCQQDMINIATAKSAGDANKIQFHLGMSVDVLPKLFEQEQALASEPAFWFFDAHSVMPHLCPLLQELRIVLDNGGRGIFLFDDLRLFDKFEDWKGINVKSIAREFELRNIPITSPVLYKDMLLLSTFVK